MGSPFAESVVFIGVDETLRQANGPVVGPVEKPVQTDNRREISGTGPFLDYLSEIRLSL